MRLCHVLPLVPCSWLAARFLGLAAARIRVESQIFLLELLSAHHPLALATASNSATRPRRTGPLGSLLRCLLRGPLVSEDARDRKGAL